MTIMMNTPDDSDYQALLQDYMAAPEDDGFSQSVLKTINKQQMRSARIRIWLIGFACSLGGVIAGTQVKAFVNLLSDYTVAGTTVTSLAAVLVFGFVVWATLDNREAGPL